MEVALDSVYGLKSS